MGAEPATGAAAAAEWTLGSLPVGQLRDPVTGPVGPATQRRMASGVESAILYAGFQVVLRDHLPDGRGTVVGERGVVVSPLPPGAWVRRFGAVAIIGAVVATVGAFELLRILPGGLLGVLLVVLGVSGLGYLAVSYVRMGTRYESELLSVSFTRDPPPPDGKDPYAAGPAQFPTRISVGRVRSFDASSREPGRTRTRGVWSVEPGSPELQSLSKSLLAKLPGEPPSYELTTPTE
jgi:hypothetical protein